MVAINIFSITEYTVQSSVDRINELNGGINPELDNIIFTNGALDPWRGVALLDDPANMSYVYVIPGKKIINLLFFLKYVIIIN